MKASAPSSLLRAKLAVPEVVPRALVREELQDELWSLTDVPVTVITGPPGSGKTQLVAAWLGDAGPGEPVAWLTIDRDDRLDPDRMWRHLFAALRAAGAMLPPALLDEAEPAGTDHRSVIEAAAALARSNRPLLLVLDNATWLDARQFGELDYLVRHAEGLRLVLIGRSRPRFPLHRYRLTDQLSELPASALTLGPEQVRELFELHDVELDDEALADVMRQTRGWIAGVRLAALAMEEHPDEPVPNLAAHPHVVEYFTGEILDGLTDEQARLLAGVALLDTFTPELLGGAGVLDELAEAGALLEPADEEGLVHRLHPLFGAVLRERLPLPPEQVRALRLRAARALAEAGDVTGAIGHAVAVGDAAEAAEMLVEHLGVGVLLLEKTNGDLSQLIGALAEPAATPAGTVVAAAAAVARGDVEEAERLMLRHAADDSASAELTLAACLVQQALAYYAGDAARLSAAVGTGRGLLEGLGRDRVAPRPELRIFVGSGVATAALCAGRLAEAAEAFAEAALAAAGRLCDELLVYCAQHLAFAEAHRGHLHTAHSAAQRALGLAAELGPFSHGPHTVVDATLALVAAERYDVPRAWRHLRAAEAGLPTVAGLPQEGAYADTLALVRSRLLRARGELPAALSAVRDGPAGPHAPAWLGHQRALAELRLLIAMGRDQEARDALAGLDPGRPEVALLGGLARLAAGEPGSAIETADLVLREPDLPLAAVIEAWLLLAAAVARHGDRDRAIEALRMAAELMAEQGGVRPLYESDVILRRLLREQNVPLGPLLAPAAAGTPFAPDEDDERPALRRGRG